MLRTIAAAAIVFAFAAFSIHYSPLLGRFEEPLLLLVMGALFLVAGKAIGAQETTPADAPEARPLEEREVA